MALDKPLKLNFLSVSDVEPLEARKDKRIQDQQSQLSYLQKRNQQLEEENQQLKATQAQLKKEQQRLEQQLQKLEALIKST